MQPRHGLAAALAIAALAVGACTDTPTAQAPSPETSASPTAGPSPTPSPTPSTTPTPSPSPTEAAEPPEIDLTADSEQDFERVVQDILTFRDWLFAHPTQSHLVSTIYWPTCDCAERLESGLKDLAQAQHRILVDAPSSVEDIDVETFEPASRGARLVVTWRVAPAEQLDDVNNVVEQAPADEIRQLWLMGRNASGQWRVDALAER